MIFGGELGLDQVEDPASLGAGGHGEVAGVEGPEVVGPQEAAVRLGLGPGVASDAQGGLVAQNRVADQRRLQKQIAHDAGRELLLHQVENLPRLRAGSSDQVAGVPAVWSRKPAPATASSISVWVRPDVQYWVSVAVSRESSSVLG